MSYSKNLLVLSNSDQTQCDQSEMLDFVSTLIALLYHNKHIVTYVTPSVTETSVFLLKLLKMAPYIETPSLLIYLISIKKAIG